MRTFDEILTDKILTPGSFDRPLKDTCEAAAKQYAKEAVDEVTDSLSELIRTLQRINNKTRSTLDHEDWKRMKNAQAVLAKYADHSSPRIVQSKTE